MAETSVIHSVIFKGIEPQKIKVEVQILKGLPALTIVGLADKAVSESKERVRSALSACGVPLPAKKIVINLAPADVVKEGSYFDLPIALGLICAMGILPNHGLEKSIVMGELGLNGDIRAVAGVLPAAMAAKNWEMGFIGPAESEKEALWSGNPSILSPMTLNDLINHFKGVRILSSQEIPEIEQSEYPYDFCDVKGQETAKRALEIAAAGGHNLLMIGPPGSGKSMLAKRFPSILPPMTRDEILQVSQIYSIAGLLKDGSLMTSRPFRNPHHSASMPSLTGGGTKAVPGEISLAHRGVLFLDELPEFSRTTLEALRQPMESGEVLISRVNNHCTYPSSFQLIAAMNPCRCGYYGTPGHECSRAPKCAAEYQSKISGPIYDRIDLHVVVPELNPIELSRLPSGEKSADIAIRVKKAIDIQRQRYAGTGYLLNAEVDNSLLEKYIVLSEKSIDILEKATRQMHLSARGYHRILKVARTIADLSGEVNINEAHITEALSYRHIRVD